MTQQSTADLLRSIILRHRGRLMATDVERESYLHAARLPGMTPDALGYERCRQMFRLMDFAANHLTDGRYVLEKTYDNHEHNGYVVLVSDSMTKLRLHLCHDAISKGRPLPLHGVSKNART